MRITILTTVAAMALTVLVAAPASAAYPGVNGTIAFTSDRDGNSRSTR